MKLLDKSALTETLKEYFQSKISNLYYFPKYCLNDWNHSVEFHKIFLFWPLPNSCLHWNKMCNAITNKDYLLSLEDHCTNFFCILDILLNFQIRKNHT